MTDYEIRDAIDIMLMNVGEDSKSHKAVENLLFELLSIRMHPLKFYDELRDLAQNVLERKAEEDYDG